MPFLSVMYLLFRSPRLAGGANQLLTHSLLGVPLGAHWLSGAAVLGAHGAVFLGVFAVLAGLCWLSARIARRIAPATAAAPTPGVQRLISTVLPYATVVFAAFLPLAAGLYLVTTVAWSTAERWLYARERNRPAEQRTERAIGSASNG